MLGCGGAPTPADPNTLRAQGLLGSWKGADPYTGDPRINYWLFIQRQVNDSIFGDCGGPPLPTCSMRGRVVGDTVTFRWPRPEDPVQHFVGTVHGREIRGLLSLECPTCTGARELVLQKQ